MEEEEEEEEQGAICGRGRATVEFLFLSFLCVFFSSDLIWVFSFVRSSRVDCFLQNFPFVFSSPSIGFSFSSFKVRLLVPVLVLLLLFASRASSASSRSYKKGGRDHAKSLF